MAIKVKHEGNVASRLAGAADGGRAKRAMEAAALAKPSQIVQKQAAHASAPGISAAHAQLISAPGGGAHAGLMGGGGGLGATFGRGRAGSLRDGGGGLGTTRLSSGAGGGTGDYKVTGTSVFDRPDAESQWDPSAGRWVRPWLPGEKEAEAAERMGYVKNAQEQAMYEFKLTADQKNELAKINKSIEDARRSGRFSDDEMAELERQAYERRMGIKPLPTPREKDAQKSFEERLVTVGGIQGYINAHGDFAPIEKDDGFANFLKVYPKLAEYTEDETITDPAATVPVTKTRTADEIAKLVADAQTAWRKAKNPQGAPTPTGKPVVPQTTQEGEVPAVATNKEEALKKWGVRK